MRLRFGRERRKGERVFCYGRGGERGGRFRRGWGPIVAGDKRGCGFEGDELCGEGRLIGEGQRGFRLGFRLGLRR